MKITEYALSLNVADPEASAKFLIDHFGFEVRMSAEEFVSLSRPEGGLNVIYLRTGLSSFKPERIADSAGQGTLVVFVVEDIDAEYERVQREGVPIETPIETEPWGERYFQMRDPNGIVVQLVQWVTVPAGAES
ncbi:VOC family protein [Nocardia sp. CDC159]|uniref:VOC family protein n=1 Tax=Nocardia pulmonis TaxID=2951408 RepID=A0A9X2E8D2_9NOCA|nr:MULTISPECIES: VOC family protein [Nocardia]MCM6774765.1 VOC family protein [Nocardia pulmonis]MCM6789696.1 VOC family protein [Nocardia sp. CDC159]